MFVLGMLTHLFNLDHEKLSQIIENQFNAQGREHVFRNAMLAFDAGYAYQIGDSSGPLRDPCRRSPRRTPRDHRREHGH